MSTSISGSIHTDLPNCVAQKDYALCKLGGVNSGAENFTRSDAVNGIGAGFHLPSIDYSSVGGFAISSNQPKGQNMKNKLDLMNHVQRAAFARSLFHKPEMARNAVTAANAYGIRRSK